MAYLEHVNVNVSDADEVAHLLGGLFGWKVRYRGVSMDGKGVSLHVGGAESYIALYQPGEQGVAEGVRYATSGALNHIGVVVEDLDATEAKVIAAGYTPGEHQDYEPGRRFYFDGPDGIEFEVVCYT